MYAPLLETTSRKVAVWLARVWLWLKKAQSIQCRDCGLRLLPEQLPDFVKDGCLECGGMKLKAVRDAE